MGQRRGLQAPVRGFATEVADSLLRTGYLMTGDARDAEDLVQETLLRVARRWNRVRSMDHPAAYARRDPDQFRARRCPPPVPAASRTGAARWPAPMPPTTARRGHCGRSMTSRSSAGRWPAAARERAVLVLRYWADLPVAEVAQSSAARPPRSPAPRPAQQPGWPRSLTRSGPPSTGPPPGPS